MTLPNQIVRFLAILSALASSGNAIPMMDFPTSISKGFFMKYQMIKREFALDSTLPVLEVSFNFSTEYDYPELPSWLHLEQRRSSASAFFYGTPGRWAENTKIEVISWDKGTYETDRHVQDVNIGDNKPFPYFQAEFFIKNKTLDQFLKDGDDTLISKIVKDNYWSPDDLGLTLVMSAIGHGGRIPLPGSNNHEGVIVRVGSSRMWPEANNSVLQEGKEPSRDYFKDQGFEIDWSRFRWVDLRTVESPEAERQKLLPSDRIITAVAYNPPALDDDKRDFEIDFILIVIIPIIIILLFVLILSIIMCFGREGKRKRDQQTPHLKLTHHHNIQRSTLRLRELSKPRDVDNQHPGSEDPTRPAHAHGDYSRLADDDDDRTDGRNAPPPYRMPPGSAGKGEPQHV